MGLDYKNTAKNIIIINELKNILNEFNKLNIEIMVIKGASLIETVYPDISKRKMFDVDLLIHSEDLPKIKEKLINSGYELKSFEKIHFVKKNGFCVILDIHNSIWYIENIDEIWKSALKIKIYGADTLTMCPEDHLIYIIVHSLIEHSYFTENLKSDIELILKHYDKEISWDKILIKSKKYNVSVALYCALSFIKKVSEVNIPDYVFKRLKPSTNKFLESKLYSLILEKKIKRNIGFLLQLLVLKGIRSKIKFMFNLFYKKL